jgi:hypothetical protein
MSGESQHHHHCLSFPMKGCRHYPWLVIRWQFCVGSQVAGLNCKPPVQRESIPGLNRVIPPVNMACPCPSAHGVAEQLVHRRVARPVATPRLRAAQARCKCRRSLRAITNWRVASPCVAGVLPFAQPVRLHGSRRSDPRSGPRPLNMYSQRIKAVPSIMRHLHGSSGRETPVQLVVTERICLDLSSAPIAFDNEIDSVEEGIQTQAGMIVS